MRQIAKVRAASARSTGPGADFWSQVFNLLENQLTFGSKAHLFANLKIFKAQRFLISIAYGCDLPPPCGLLIKRALRFQRPEASSKF